MAKIPRERVFDNWYAAIASGELRKPEYYPDMLNRIYTDMTKKQQKKRKKKYESMCNICKKVDKYNPNKGRRGMK